MDWSQALGRGHFTPSEKDAASRWGTCAIGFDPRGSNSKLEQLGEAFYKHVVEDNVAAAIKVFKRIEKAIYEAQTKEPVESKDGGE